MKEKITRDEFLKLKEELAREITKILELSNESFESTEDYNSPSYQAERDAFYAKQTEKIFERFDTYKKLIESLTQYDLSEISFEDWNGLLLFTNKHENDYPVVEADFSDTFANLDFSMIQFVGDNFDFHSCKIKNLEKAVGNLEISEEIFDREVVQENNAQFLSQDIPEEVRRRFSSGRLEIIDLITYEEIFRKAQGHVMSGVEFLTQMNWEEAQKIDTRLLDLLPRFYVPKINVSNEQEITAEIVNEELVKYIREEILNAPFRRQREYPEFFRKANPDLIFREENPELFSEEGQLKEVDLEFIYENALTLKGKKIKTSHQITQLLKFIGEETIDKMLEELTLEQAQYLMRISTSNFRESTEFKEKIDVDKLVKLELDEKFAVLRSLSDTQIGKKTEFLSQAAQLIKVINQEDITFLKHNGLIHKYGIEKLIAIGAEDMESITAISKEESLEILKKYFEVMDKEFFIEHNEQTGDAEAFEKYGVDFYIGRGFRTKTEVTKARYSGINLMQIKELQEQGIGADALINNANFINFLNKFGIENIIRLSEESGNLFDSDPNSKNNSLNILSDIYAWIDYKKVNEQFEYEEFLDEVIKCIKVAKERKITIPGIEKISDSIKEKIPGEFLTRQEIEAVLGENKNYMVEEVLKHFKNGTFSPEYIYFHQEIIPILEQKELKDILSLKGKIKVAEEKVNIPIMSADGINRLSTDTKAVYEVINMTDYICEKFGKAFLLNLCKNYSAVYLNKAEIIINGDETEEQFLEAVDKAIVEGIKNDRQYTHDKVEPEFKAKHPELFLEYDVEETIKYKFYRKSLNIDDLKNPKVREALEGKDFLLGTKGYFDQHPEIRDLYKNLKLDEFYTLVDTYGRYLENARVSNLYSIIRKNENYMELIQKELEKIIEKNVLNRTTTIDDNPPEFLKKKYPQFFIDGLDEEDRKKYYDFKGNATFSAFFRNFQGEKLKAFEGKDITINFNMSKTPYQISYAEFFKNFSMEQILGEFSEYGPEIDRIVSAKKVDMLKKAYDKFGVTALKAPELICTMQEEDLDKINLSNYFDLVKKSNFHLNREYRKDNTERLVAKMYLLLGYDNTAEFFKLPEMSKDELARAIEEKEEEFNEACELRFSLKGDIKVVTELFRKLDLSQYQNGNKKIQFEIYKNINMNLENGFEGSLEELLSDSIAKAGCMPNEEHLKTFGKYVNGILTAQKMEKLNPYVYGTINENLTATGANKKIISDILINEIRKNLLENGKLDRDLLVEKLQKEILEKTREDGNLFYSPQVRNHFAEVEKIVALLDENESVKEMTSRTAVDSLKSERERIGNGWIRKVLNVPTELSLEEIENLESKLYGKSEEHAIEYEKKVVVKSKAKEKAYELFGSLENPLIMTISKAEIIFDGINPPYSQEFVNFFVAHRKEILERPELYTKISNLHGEFENIINKSEIRNRYAAGVIGLDQMFELLEKKDLPYGMERDGDWELSRRARESSLTEHQFELAQKILEKMKEREYQTVPPVKDVKAKKYRGRILRSDDPLHLVIGEIATCCQHISGVGETSMLHSALEKNGSLFVVEEVDEFGNVVNTIAQSWTWRNNDVICFDNIEIPDILKPTFSNQDWEEITAVYQDAAKAMLRTDAKMMKKMLDEGRITQKQYDALVAKEVIVGRGCNDLKALEEKGRFKLPRKKALPVEYGKSYFEYRDSSGDGVLQLYTDATFTYSFATIDDVKDEVELMPKLETATSVKEDRMPEVPKGYGKSREILIHKGSEINKDDLDSMERIRMKKSPDSQYRFKGINGKIELADALDVDVTDLRLLISRDEEWYILGSENSDSIQIEDAVRTTKDESHDERTEVVDRMVGLEMASKVYDLMLEASSKDKRLLISTEFNDSGINFESLVQKGIIAMSKDSMKRVITLKDREKLEEENKKIKSLLAITEETLTISGTEKIKEQKDDEEIR